MSRAKARARAQRATDELKKLIDPDGVLKPVDPAELEAVLAQFRTKPPAPKVPAPCPPWPPLTPRQPGWGGG